MESGCQEKETMNPTFKNHNISSLLCLPVGRFYLSFQSSTGLREWELTAALRSRLGEILKGRFCVYMDYLNTDCKGKNCDRQTACPYCQLFAPTPDSLEPACIGQNRRPPNHPARPYMLRVLGSSGNDAIRQGEQGRVELTLIGERSLTSARPMLESVLHAAASINPGSVGSRNTHFPVLDVSGWEADLPRKNPDGSWELVTMDEVGMSKGPLGAPLDLWVKALTHELFLNRHDSSLSLCFTTPVQSRRLDKEFAFQELVKGIVARLRDLAAIYHPGCDMGHLSREFFELAGRIPISGQLEHCSRWRSYPAQKKAMDLGGWVGTLTLGGQVSYFYDLLLAGSVVGFGRKFTYGLGRFVLSLA